MKILDFLCDLFEVDSVEEITDAMIDDFLENYSENAVRKRKPRKVKYSNYGHVVTTADERRCKECGKYDGKHMSKKQFDSIFPLHKNCRCKWVKD